MNPKLRKLRLIAVSLVMAAATGQSGAADPRHGDDGPLLLASLSANTASHFPPQLGRQAELFPLPYDTVAFGDDPLAGQVPSNPYSVQLYPTEKRGGMDVAAASVLQSAAPSPNGKGVAPNEERAGARKTLLPEPGNWAMVLAGLLGVGAIARRRMSA